MTRGTTVGTHNLNVHDGKARATPFAEWLMWTEVSDGDLDGMREWGYMTSRCALQRTLAVSWHADTFTKRRTLYRPAHPGVPRVTPHRGTYAVLGVDADNYPTALVVEWKINAARPPYRRGEALMRRGFHRLHSKVTRRLVMRLVRKGYRVYVAGDPNLPRWERAYPYLPHEVGANVGHGLDRIGANRRLGQVSGLDGAERAHRKVSARVMR